jgi:hypothetical protein
VDLVEEWVEIEAGAYLLSNTGKLKALAYESVLYQSHQRPCIRHYRERMMKPVKTRGTWVFHIFRNPPIRVLFIHLALARNFLDNPDCRRQVGFKDGDRDNYQLSNLYWY